jgi:GntR family transcriptional regulator of vanillate catabolism
VPRLAPELPSRATPLGAALVERLRALVLAGEVAAGARMNEVHLAARLGTSRTPVREALGVLAGEGLLDHAPRRGYRVRETPPREVEDAFQTRAVLEALAARQAAEQGLGAATRAEIAAALAEGDRVLARARLTAAARDAYRRANVRFHEAVLAASGNRLLDRMVRLSLNLPLSSLSHIPPFTADELRRRHDDHHRIFEAIEGRDAWRAELLMREHVLRVRDAAARRAPPAGTPLA